MATDPNDKGRPLNPSEAAQKREAEAMEVEDKLAALIWVATPEEPRYTPPSEEERQTSRAVGQVEADIPLMAELVKPGVGRSWTGMLFPSLFVLLLLFIAVLGFAMLRQDEQSAAPAAPVDPAAPVSAAGADTNPAPKPTPTKSFEEPRPTPESTTTTDCVLPASTVQVAIVNDREEPSAFMPGLMMQVWDVNFTNDTAEAVVVGAHYTSTRNGTVITEEWIKRKVSPGRTEYESSSRDLTVKGKRAEQASLIFDRLLVVENRDACMPLLDDPQVQAQAVELPVPPTP